MRRVLLMLIVVAGAALLDTAPAHACSCASSTDATAFARADAVFQGEVVDYKGPEQREVMSSAAPVTWTFAVTAVFKGDVSERQEIVSEWAGASCGLEIAREGEFYVFAHVADHVPVDDGQYYAGLCGGTRPVGAGIEVGVIGTAPTPAPPPEPAGSWAAEVVGVTALLTSALGFTIWRIHART